MDIVAIHTTNLKAKSGIKPNQVTSKETRQVRVVKTLNAFIFQLHDKKFAIDLSCIVRSSKNYAEIHRFDDKTPYLIGFTFINNELVKILNLIEILSFSKKTNNNISTTQRLLEIAYNNMNVGVLVDDIDFETKTLQITDEHIRNVNRNPSQFKWLDAVIQIDNEEIFLLNEKNLFNEIQMKINYNETTRHYQC